jgi:hypothetical protein
MDHCRKRVDNVSSEDGVVGILNVNDIEGYDFSSHGCASAEGHIYVSFDDSFGFLSTEVYQGVHLLLQILLYETHLDEAPPGEDIYGASCVY